MVDLAKDIPLPELRHYITRQKNTSTNLYNLVQLGGPDVKEIERLIILFLIDYAHRRRIKIWGRARVVEDDSQLVQSLMPEGYKARPEQAFLLTVSAWDANCPQHIPQRFEAADVAAALEERYRRIEELTKRLKDLDAPGRIGSPG